MSNYSDHVDNCPRRHQDAQENRDRSPGRNMNEREQIRERSPVQPSQPRAASNERDRSPPRGSSQEAQSRGGITGFLRNLASSAANHIRSRSNDQSSDSYSLNCLEAPRVHKDKMMILVACFLNKHQ